MLPTPARGADCDSTRERAVVGCWVVSWLAAPKPPSSCSAPGLGSPDQRHLCSGGLADGRVYGHTVTARPGDSLQRADDGTEWSGLLQAARRGDSDAAGRLLAPHRADLVRVIQRRVPHDDAEDLCQESQMAAILSIRRFRGHNEASFRAWMRGIARHVVAHYYRNRTRQSALAAPLSAAYAGDRSIANVDEMADAEVWLTSLTASQRQTVLMRALYDLPFALIGSELGISAGAARLQFFRARMALKKAVRPQGATEVLADLHPRRRHEADASRPTSVTRATSTLSAGAQAGVCQVDGGSVRRQIDGTDRPGSGPLPVRIPTKPATPTSCSGTHIDQGTRWALPELQGTRHLDRKRQ